METITLDIEVYDPDFEIAQALDEIEFCMAGISDIDISLDTINRMEASN